MFALLLLLLPILRLFLHYDDDDDCQDDELTVVLALWVKCLVAFPVLLCPEFESCHGGLCVSSFQG